MQTLACSATLNNVANIEWTHLRLFCTFILQWNSDRAPSNQPTSSRPFVPEVRRLLVVLQAVLTLMSRGLFWCRCTASLRGRVHQSRKSSNGPRA